MSCSQATAPIDISRSGSDGTCELKCEYSFSYNNSDTSVTNNGDYLELTYDQASVAPVKFNDSSYRVDSIRIYQPSLHTFDGNNADAEIVIKHSGDSGNLLVCVPVIKSSSVTKSASLLNTIMPKVKSYAYADGQSANLNISNFNLNFVAFTTCLVAFFHSRNLCFFVSYQFCNMLTNPKSSVEVKVKS